MSANPGQIEKDTNAILAAWKKFAPTATFGGYTLAQYTLKVQPSLDARAEITDHQESIASWTDKRDDADLVTNDTNQTIIKGIVGDPNYGDNSDLYEGCGYVRKNEKASGLTRKDAQAVKAEKAAAKAAIKAAKATVKKTQSAS